MATGEPATGGVLLLLDDDGEVEPFRETLEGCCRAAECDLLDSRAPLR